MWYHARVRSGGLMAERPGWAAGRATVLAVIVAGAAATWGGPAAGESMREALGSAYQSNPEIDAGRARLRATDEDVQRARAGWGPQIGAGASVGIRNETVRPGGSLVTRPRDLSVQVTQPLFTGLRTYNDVNVAEAGVRAGRAELRAVEARVLAAAAQAYANVQRDRAIVRLAEQFVKALAEDLDAARERRSIGEVTLTDVDQARNRLAGAKVSLSEARGVLRSSEADYRRLVGRMPSETTVKGIVLGGLPGTVGEAVAIAHRENPGVEQALYLEQAARYGVERERAELLPRVDLEAAYRRAYGETELADRSDTAELIGRLQVPLYQGGEQRARVRQAKHVHVGRLQDVETARRQAEGDVNVAWATLTAAREQIALDRDRVAFARAALKGVRDEERVGQRTLLDVLNSEEELFQARRSFEQNFRNMVVAHYEVLRAMGRLDSRFLKLAKEQYDPETHYFEARGKWLTTAIGGERAAKRGGRDDRERDDGCRSEWGRDDRGPASGGRVGHASSADVGCWVAHDAARRSGRWDAGATDTGGATGDRRIGWATGSRQGGAACAGALRRGAQNGANARREGGRAAPWGRAGGAGQAG